MKIPNFWLILVVSFVLMSCTQEHASQSNAAQTAPPEPEVVSESNAADATVKSDCAFRLGFDVWAPYQFVDLNNQVSGLDIELISDVASLMDCDLEFVQGTWRDLLQGLENGNIDMLLGASKTPARETFAHFSLPYRQEEFVLYIRTNEPEFAAFKSIDDFIQNGSKIGLVSEYFYGDEISSMLDSEDKADHFVFGIMGELNVARLLDMDIDAYLEDSFVGASIIRRKALSSMIEPHSIRITTGDIYVMFSKSNVTEAQVEAFNVALANYKMSDKYRTVLNKYTNL
ncbi:amino acid ABC transporter substrate-binding protein [Alteromonas sediminis]|uniref:Amino acid ABC transporter substrate-binding protein n=1 Tax=Alteromonas sediminis TaxID=2259342 RepID=A0A3N5Y4V7_9ALTE|nr:transporter substrate-binding domain-containing protein [Alteromonas sediminis]RPJ67966.1 amino acid ABC transporter substrate-binding protein [Alteromonas sediminis]